MASGTLDADRWRALADMLGRGPDESVGDAYRRVHDRLVTLFECRALADPPALADETLDRVARKLEEGLEVEHPDPLRYVLGVARFVALEASREDQRTKPLGTPSVREDDDAAERERLLAAMDGCLEGMHDAERRVLLEYHRGLVGREKTRHRRALAEDLGLTEVNLRSRAARLRVRLKRCIESRLRDETSATKQGGDAQEGETP
ncbi:MAG: hypothetical protein RMA76_27600 [Deltaproteobacteria bacterium]